MDAVLAYVASTHRAERYGCRWHWEEKDRMEWAKARLAELFSGMFLIEQGGTKIKVERLKDLTGDVSTRGF
jgi:activator of HSP90 ATPase